MSMTEQGIGRELVRRRLSLGLTQLDIAEAVGASDAAVSHWEDGRVKRLSPKYIPLLAKVLQLDVALLVDWLMEVRNGD